MSKVQTMPLEIWTDINGNAARTQFKGGTKYIRADAQATVEALQAQLQEGEVAYHKVGEYNDHLKQQVEALRRELEHAKKMEAVQKEVADNQTWHVRELRAALDAEREKVKNTEKAYQEKARLWIEQTGALTQLQALVRAVSDTMEPFRKSMAKLDEVDTLATRRIAEADAYYCAQRVLTTLDALTPAGGGQDGRNV